MADNAELKWNIGDKVWLWVGPFEIHRYVIRGRKIMSTEDEKGKRVFADYLCGREWYGESQLFATAEELRKVLDSRIEVHDMTKG